MNEPSGGESEAPKTEDPSVPTDQVAAVPVAVSVQAEPPRSTQDDATMSYGLIKQALQEVLDSGGEATLTKKFSGGKILIQPAKADLQAKEIPIDEFFKKVIRVRDQLRVLEQKINNHDSLTSADKATFQSYITRSYGALTSFNILFKDKDDHFKGQSSK
ncbi:MAG: hypothetical protein P1V97_29045 [Planctomycetota bacterium]|nr:hypothetical protein [Planctomycetota bacterium]